MIESVNKLIKAGCDEDLALLLCWHELSEEYKASLHIEQCLQIWRQAPSDSLKKSDIWKTVKAKIDSLERCLWVWGRIPSGIQEQVDIWKMVKAQTKTFKQSLLVLGKTSTDSTEGHDALAIVTAKAAVILATK